MSDDLKRRLWSGDKMNGKVVNCSLDQCNCVIMDEAADYIAALEAQLAEVLKREADTTERYDQRLAEAHMQILATDGQAQEAYEAQKRAEADRDAAVAAALEEAAGVAYQWWDDDDAYELRDHIRDLIPQSGADALERARAVAVKPLVWEEHIASNGKRQIAYAVTPLVTYRITQKFFPETFFSIEVVDGAFLSAKTLEAAKAAAQADYERRIRSALVHVNPDMLAQARAAGMREAAGIAAPHPDHDKSDWTEYAHHASRLSNLILAAIEKGEG